MGIVRRGIVFMFGTFTNAILFLFHSRVVLEVVETANSFGQGPASGAINLLPDVMQLAIGAIQVILIIYLLGGLGEERAANRRPMP